MKRIIRLNEGDLLRIVKRVIEEQIIQGKPNDPWEYRKDGENYYARKKGSQNWILATGKSKDAISKNIFGVKNASQQQFCEPHPKDSRVSPQLEKNYQPYAIKLSNLGVPKRLACEVSFIKLRPELNQKPFFVVDTKQNLIYLFDSKGNFVAKTYTLDGKSAQSEDAKKVAAALMSYSERLSKAGYTYDQQTKKYKDKKGNILNNPDDLFYELIDKSDTRFFPKGIYSVRYLATNKDYAGGEQNVFMLRTMDGKNISQAIHGYYKEPARIEALNKLKSKMGKSDMSNPKVTPEFINYVQNYLNSSNLNKSYGCINVPEDFLIKVQSYAKQNPLVFVIGETNENYLVQNPSNFFQKLGTGLDCVNPASLGSKMSFDNIA